MTDSSIFLGSGASMTLVPEVDFYFMPIAGTTATVQIEATNAVQFQLVKDMYVGCSLDWYDGGTVYTSSHIITENDHDTFTITPSLAAATAAADSFVLRAYGAPCPAPSSTNGANDSDSKKGKTRLLADNWLGLIETASFPNIEVEMKQLNLSLGGSRNFTHQYKGIETSSGGNLALVCNQVTWLYYALGKCTSLSIPNASTSQHPSNYHEGTHGGLYYNATAQIDEGPFIYRNNAVNGGNHLVPPLSFIADNTVGDLDAVPFDDGQIAATGGLISYTFDETNGSHLPSFALEYSLTKDVTNNLFSNNEDEDEDINFVRIARGNRVNTLTLTANENEEVKMTMDLNTRTVTPIPRTLASPSTGYESRGGQTSNSGLLNFTTVAGHLEPFFFSDGSLSIYGQSFLKVTNFTLTINNNLQDKRFIGIGSKSIKSGLPAQRTYEIALTALVTDDTLFKELLNQDENNAANQSIDLVFTKDSGETFTLAFDDYFTSANTWTVPDDKGAITVEATLMPRTLTTCTTTTSWVLQG